MRLAVLVPFTRRDRRRLARVTIAAAVAATLVGCSSDRVVGPFDERKAKPSADLQTEGVICVRPASSDAPGDTTAVAPDGSCEAGYDHTPWWFTEG